MNQLQSVAPSPVDSGRDTSSASLPRERPSPSVHLLAGASGGIVTAVLTSPLDVLRTRLQSDIYRDIQAPARRATRPIQHFYETAHIIRSIHSSEGLRGFFRGLVPSIVGVVPATAIKFYTYGSCKSFGATLGYGDDDAFLHAQAAVAAGITTATATNPIWLIKTRLQLEESQRYRNTIDCVRRVVAQEGIRGLYRGLSASYLGTVETALHLVLYEQLKKLYRKSMSNTGVLNEELSHWISTSAASGSAKVATVLLTYPHEVVRTRLRQAPSATRSPRYTGLWQCFRSVGQTEGLAGLYGGLIPHMARSIPSAIITLGVYEFVLRISGPQ